MISATGPKTEMTNTYYIENKINGLKRLIEDIAKTLNEESKALSEEDAPFSLKRVKFQEHTVEFNVLKESLKTFEQLFNSSRPKKHVTFSQDTKSY
ncbi:MAG: hypothetical protein JHC93_05840 [Parachlamydiales bacterium]|nr:hypothetical protein [Parachlamydiales bacterium]